MKTFTNLFLVAVMAVSMFAVASVTTPALAASANAIAYDGDHGCKGNQQWDGHACQPKPVKGVCPAGYLFVKGKGEDAKDTCVPIPPPSVFVPNPSCHNRGYKQGCWTHKLGAGADQIVIFALRNSRASFASHMR